MDKLTYLFLVLIGVILLTCVYRLCWLYPWVWRHRLSLNESFDNLLDPSPSPASTLTDALTSTPIAPLSIPPLSSSNNTPVFSDEADIASKKQEQSQLISHIKDKVRQDTLTQNTFNNQPTLTCKSGGGSCGCPLISGGKYGTPGLLQGMECLTKKQQECLKHPDEFIRKDSIPCWGCSL